MYFSRITLREDAHLSQDFWQVFRDPYTLHQSIWRLFADHADRRRDFLYRLDQEGQKPVIYTVSERKPDSIAGMWRIETKDYRPKIMAGMQLAFMLRVNPVRTKRDEKGRQCRHDIVMEAKTQLKDKKYQEDNRNGRKSVSVIAQEEGGYWLLKRAEKYGFAIKSDHLLNDDIGRIRVDCYQQHRLSKGNGSKPILFSTLDFAGVLTVTDPASFIETLYKGIGPAKGFGCGLMLVKRA